MQVWFTLFRHLQLLFISVKQCPGEWFCMIHLKLVPALYFSAYTCVDGKKSGGEKGVCCFFRGDLVWVSPPQKKYFPFWTTQTNTTVLTLQTRRVNIFCVFALKKKSMEYSRAIKVISFRWVMFWLDFNFFFLTMVTHSQAE